MTEHEWGLFGVGFGLGAAIALIFCVTWLSVTP
jgi:hypothetical protein